MPIAEARAKFKLWSQQKEIRNRWPPDAVAIREWIKKEYLPMPGDAHTLLDLIELSKGQEYLMIYYGPGYFGMKRFRPLSFPRMLDTKRNDGGVRGWYPRGVVKAPAGKMFNAVEKGINTLANIHLLRQEHEFYNKNVHAITGRKGALIFAVEKRRFDTKYRVARLWLQSGRSVYTKDQFSITKDIADDVFPRIQKAIKKARAYFEGDDRASFLTQETLSAEEVDIELGGYSSGKED